MGGGRRLVSPSQFFPLFQVESARGRHSTESTVDCSNFSVTLGSVTVQFAQCMVRSLVFPELVFNSTLFSAAGGSKLGNILHFLRKP